jgi:hypothetical protein
LEYNPIRPSIQQFGNYSARRSESPAESLFRIAWHSPSHCEWTANQNRTAEKAFAANFDMKFSAQVFLSATYGHVEALQPKTVPRVRIPLPPPHSLKCCEHSP